MDNIQNNASKWFKVIDLINTFYLVKNVTGERGVLIYRPYTLLH